MIHKHAQMGFFGRRGRVGLPSFLAFTIAILMATCAWAQATTRDEDTSWRVSIPTFNDSTETPPPDGVTYVDNDAEMKRCGRSTKKVMITNLVTHDLMLRELPRLDKLEVFEEITNGVYGECLLKALAGCAMLKEIHFRGGAIGFITNENASSIVLPQTLETFSGGTDYGFTEQLLNILSRSPNLKDLHLWKFSGCASPSAIPAIAPKGIGACAALEDLCLQHMKIDESIMNEILSLPRLKALYLHSCDISAEAAKKLGVLCAKLDTLSLANSRIAADVQFKLPTTTAADGTETTMPPTVKTLYMTGTVMENYRAPYTYLVESVAELHSLEELDLTAAVGFQNGRDFVVNVTGPETLTKLAKLTNLRKLSLGGHQTDSNVFESFGKAMPHLEYLNLRRSWRDHLTPEAIESLRAFKSLKELNIEANTIHAEHAAAIGKLTSLEVLSLAGCADLDDTCCAQLANLKSLKSLDLSGTKVAADGLRSIATISTLQRLNLTDCVECSPSAWPTMPNLEALWLTGSAVGDSGIPTPKSAPKLTALSIGRSKQRKITKDGMPKIGEIKTLRFLDVSGVVCSGDDFKSVQKLPQLSWLVIGKWAVVDGFEAISKPLGSGGFSKLMRLDVKLDSGSDYFKDQDGKVIRWNAKDVESNLKKRFSRAAICVHVKTIW